MRRLHGEGQCKDWLSKEKIKGQKNPVESTNARRYANVHRNVEMVFHPGFLFNTRSYLTPSNLAAEVSGRTMPISIYILMLRKQYKTHGE